MIRMQTIVSKTGRGYQIGDEGATAPLLAEGNGVHALEEEDDLLDNVIFDRSNHGVNETETGPILSPANSGSNTTSSATTPCFIYLLTFLAAIGGFLFGYDTGVVAGAMLLLQNQFHLDSIWIELIVSVTIGAAALFSFFGGLLNDRFGRKPTIIAASFTFTCGAVLLGAAINKTMLLVGRLILGIGIGFASTTVPMYIAECAPSQLRGRLVTLNNIFITGGQCVASVVDGAFSSDATNGWRYMFGLAGVPSLIQFIGFIFMPESPRWLVSRGREAMARKVLQQIRATDDVQEEMNSIYNALQESKLENNGQGSTLWRMLSTPHVRRALMVGCALQLFQQITGINTVMYYSATIIKMSGVKSESAAIWLAAVTAAVNFLFTFLGLYLVEKIGRRTLTLGSLAGTMLSLSVLAVAFQLASIRSPPVSIHEQPTGNLTEGLCGNYTSCDSCMMDVGCGFCYKDGPPDALNGSCLPSYQDNQGIIWRNGSMFGRCSDPERKSRLTWAYDFCPTDVSWMATFGLVLYLACFAPGMGPMPWTINSEIYPNWARSTGNSIATATNWTFNLLISMTFLTLTESLTRYGAFWLYAGFALLGLVYLYVFLPETKGKSLEDMEQVFKAGSRRGRS